MDHFLYRDGVLFAEDVAVADIAAAVLRGELAGHAGVAQEALLLLRNLACGRSSERVEGLRGLGVVGLAEAAARRHPKHALACYPFRRATIRAKAARLRV